MNILPLLLLLLLFLLVASITVLWHHAVVVASRLTHMAGRQNQLQQAIQKHA
jgi:hypothetical protein